MDIFQKCLEYTDARRARELGVYPYFRPISSGQLPRVEMGGRSVVMMGSNSYLGLTMHPEVRRAAAEAAETYGTGCSGSRFLNGTLEIHVQLEQELAEFMGKQKALLFSTGFFANLGTISGLAGRSDRIFIDAMNHASIIDGCRLSFGKIVKYQHNDAADLEEKLKATESSIGRLIVTDGVFSMEGDLADLPSLVRLRKDYGARLMVDDAHGIGVMGDHGRGTAEHYGLESEVDIVMGTFSKSFASIGGFVAADEAVIEYLMHHSRALIFSASLPPSAVATVRAALRILREHPEIRKKLWTNTHAMKRGLEELGFRTGPTQTPIIPVIVGADMTAFQMCKALESEGVFVNPVISPAVPPGKALIRVSLMASHESADIEFALEKFEVVGRRLGLIGEGVPG
ncbi:MAG: aminotransferase class I/II-fold pyridoxal phosphate-dependent enzyme [Planctomycetes bacterium]|nr:aminotransferase class I/II-fold pyridoxal phosphate-dependent enzyme [Planctomycetota bacterium]